MPNSSMIFSLRKDVMSQGEVTGNHENKRLSFCTCLMLAASEAAEKKTKTITLLVKLLECKLEAKLLDEGV